MQASRDTYESIHRLLATKGVVILRTGRAPVNPVNLFDMLVVQNGRLTIEVDDAFVREIRDLAGNSIRTL